MTRSLWLPLLAGVMLVCVAAAGLSGCARSDKKQIAGIVFQEDQFFRLVTVRHARGGSKARRRAARSQHRGQAGQRNPACQHLYRERRGCHRHLPAQPDGVVERPRTGPGEGHHGDHLQHRCRGRHRGSLHRKRPVRPGRADGQGGAGIHRGKARRECQGRDSRVHVECSRAEHRARFRIQGPARLAPWRDRSWPSRTRGWPRRR